MQRPYFISEDACSPWRSHGSSKGLCPFTLFLQQEAGFVSTELLVLGWEVEISESGAQHTFLPGLLGLWVQDNPDKLC